jgi:hypothetical protein
LGKKSTTAESIDHIQCDLRVITHKRSIGLYP